MRIKLIGSGGNVWNVVNATSVEAAASLFPDYIASEAAATYTIDYSEPGSANVYPIANYIAALDPRASPSYQNLGTEFPGGLEYTPTFQYFDDFALPATASSLNGSTHRYNVVIDPDVAYKKAFLYRLAEADGERIETNLYTCAPLSNAGVAYTVAFAARIGDTLKVDDEQSIFQIKSTDPSSGNPILALIVGRTLKVDFRYNTNNPPIQATHTQFSAEIDSDWPVNRWINFVFQFVINYSSEQSYLRVFMNEQLVVNYVGRLGFNAPGYEAYVKTGIYHYTAWAAPRYREIYMKGPVILLGSQSEQALQDILDRM